MFPNKKQLTKMKSSLDFGPDLHSALTSNRSLNHLSFGSSTVKEGLIVSGFLDLGPF